VMRCVGVTDWSDRTRVPVYLLHMKGCVVYAHIAYTI